MPEEQANGNQLTVTIDTDGSCHGNPGPGGYAALLNIPGHPEAIISGGDPRTTNNKMELAAALKGLECLIEQAPQLGLDLQQLQVRLNSDSKYVVSAFNEGWIANWQKSGWRNSRRQEVPNQHLWHPLIAAVERLNIDFHWVRGHSGDPQNEKCDEIANREASIARGSREPHHQRQLPLGWSMPRQPASQPTSQPASQETSSRPVAAQAESQDSGPVTVDYIADLLNDVRRNAYANIAKQRAEQAAKQAAAAEDFPAQAAMEPPAVVTTTDTALAETGSDQAQLPATVRTADFQTRKVTPTTRLLEQINSIAQASSDFDDFKQRLSRLTQEHQEQDAPRTLRIGL